MKKTIISIVAMMGIMSGCGYREGVTVSEPAAFLAFGGNTRSAVVHIDEAISFPLSEGTGDTIYSATGEKEKTLAERHYRLAPGKHRIQVVKDGLIVVDRELLLSDGATREVIVP